MVTTSRRLGFGNLRQLVGYYCSYQLPYSPVKMAEASQREVVTIKMGHPVLGFQEKVCTWLRAIPNRLCFTALPGTSLRDGHIFFWSTDFKVQSPARYVFLSRHSAWIQCPLSKRSEWKLHQSLQRVLVSSIAPPLLASKVQ